ncbi:MAG: hypothetical protein ACM3QZ_14390 [Solirubrobacterales bacterium]
MSSHRAVLDLGALLRAEQIKSELVSNGLMLGKDHIQRQCQEWSQNLHDGTFFLKVLADWRTA